MRWTRAALEARVDKLGEEHEGEAFVEAVRAFAGQLDEDEQEVLGQILLARAPKPRGVIRDYPRWSVILPRVWRRTRR
jgi:hypothetical protein